MAFLSAPSLGGYFRSVNLIQYLHLLKYGKSAWWSAEAQALHCDNIQLGSDRYSPATIGLQMRHFFKL